MWSVSAAGLHMRSFVPHSPAIHDLVCRSCSTPYPLHHLSLSHHAHALGMQLLLRALHAQQMGGRRSLRGALLEQALRQPS